MGRNIVAGLAGVLVAVGLVWITEMIGHSVYPPPPDIDFTDTEVVRRYISGLPFGAFLFVGGAWFIGTLGGTVTGCCIGNAQPWVFAMLIGALMLVSTAFNLAIIPHPLWFSVSGIAGIVVAACLGWLFGGKLRRR
jgi:hypothetical protein